MWPFIVLGVCVRRSENLFVCFGAKPTQRARSPARPEVEEERKVPEKTEGQLTKEDGEGQSTKEETSRREIAVQGKDSQQKDSQRWVGIPSGFWWRFRSKYTPAIVYRCTENSKCHKIPFLALGADPSPCLFVLFSHPLGCALHICNDICDTPGREPLDDSLAMNSLVYRSYSRGRQARGVITLVWWTWPPWNNQYSKSWCCCRCFFGGVTWD